MRAFTRTTVRVTTAALTLLLAMLAVAVDNVHTLGGFVVTALVGFGLLAVGWQTGWSWRDEFDPEDKERS